MSDDRIRQLELRVAELRQECDRLRDAIEAGLSATLRMDARLQRLEQQQPAQGGKERE